MENTLVQIMAQLTELSAEETQAIEESFPVKTFDKGSFLLQKGQVATDAYFVIKGCIREYELTPEGEEKTIGFYTENQSAANFKSMANQLPSQQFFVATEATSVAVINNEKEQALYQAHPRFESFCRSGMEKMIGDQQEKLMKFMVMNPKERYLNLLKERPDLLHRVPQYQIASYLGVKPETLSRIRKRMALED